MKLKDLKWTKPYHGVTHLGEMDHTNVRVSVTDYGKFALLIKYPREYGLAIETQHESAAAAKKAGMEWMEKNYSEK
jgi:hypothetical protein